MPGFYGRTSPFLRKYGCSAADKTWETTEQTKINISPFRFVMMGHTNKTEMEETTYAGN